MKRLSLALILALLPAGGALIPGSAFAAAKASAPEGEALPSRRLKLARGKSKILKFSNPLKRITVSDPKVVDALAASPTEMVLFAKGEGEASIIVLDEKGNVFAYDIQVTTDKKTIREARERLAQVLPDSKLKIVSAGEGLVISGSVKSEAAKKVALGIGALFTSKKVVDNIQIENSPQVLLKVHFAEISRSGALQVGLGLFQSRTRGTRTTQGFLFPGAPGFAPVGGTTEGIAVTFSSIMSLFFSTSRSSATSSRSSSIFLRLLQQKGFIRTLAEPHLRVVSGKKASFLVGGEVPIPVPSEDGIAITYRPFGIELEFTPTVKSNNMIGLEIAPSVSSVDDTLAIIISGITVPGFKKSNTKTQVELRDGQTMAISGLLSEDRTRIMAQIPFIGDIPILGELFKSRDFRENKSELVVLVTPQIIRSGAAAELRLPGSGFMVGRTPGAAPSKGAGRLR